MATLPTLITLSSGTKIRIPVFESYLMNTDTIKAGGVIYDQFNNNGVSTTPLKLNAEDYIELVNLLYNARTNTVDYGALTANKVQHYVSCIYWYGYNNVWTLVCQISPSNEYALVRGTIIDLSSSGDEYKFYDGANYTGTSYADTISGYTGPNKYVNIISGGTSYRIEAYYQNGIGTSVCNNDIHSMSLETVIKNMNDYFEYDPDSDINVTGTDTGNPYGIDISGLDGGDGDLELDPDHVDGVGIPTLPSLSVSSTGFITLYNPTTSNLRSLAAFLWSSAFDIDTFKKLFSDPMQAIIGLGIVPVQPTATGSQTVKFGDVDTEVRMTTCDQYVQKSMGSVSIRKWIGSFMDYSPYVDIQIYLPYIGIRSISADDVMNDTITLTYNIDVLTGGCAAIISTAKKGTLYQFNGSCICNVPLTSMNYGQAIQNAVSILGSVATTAAGIATGAAPVAAMGLTSLATNAANTAVNTKESIQRSGTMGGSAGLLSSQTPYLIINRPNMSVPDKLNTFTGNTSNVTMNLSKVKGFTMVDYIHLSGIGAMEEEKKELETILKKGAIF